MSVVYGLRNRENFRTYVGCTKGNLSKRMREHRCLLRAGKHTAIALQKDWNELGEKAFEMVVFAELPANAPIGAKREQETQWMLSLKASGLLYNSFENSYRPPDGAPAKAAAKRVENGYKPSAESNLKRRLAQLGVAKGHGAKISATKRAKAMR